MISEKMIKLAGGSSAIRAMFEEGNRLSAEFGSENVYDFSLGNPNIPAPAAVKSAILYTLENEKSTFVHGYMSNPGFPDVRAAVADSLNRRFKTGFGQNNIFMTVGAASGLNIILKTLLNPGDEVIVFSPYFVEYGNYVDNFDGVLITVPSSAPDFQPDTEALRSAITPRTKALIINTPNNPTGAVYTEKALRSVAGALLEAQEKLGTSIYLISDEPYRELVYDGASAPWLTSIYRNTIVAYSWSKSLSIPGERIGYLAIPSDIDEYALIWEAACIAGRILGYVNAPSLMQLTVAKCLDVRVDICAYDANRRLLYEALSSYGFEASYPAGAFYLWLKSPDADERRFVENAKKHRLLIVPGSSFDGPGYARIAYCVSRDMIERSLEAFKKLADDYNL